jgi:uncharacterized protein YecA (UPF0149 family)
MARLENVAFSAQDGSLRNISPKISRNNACPVNFDKKFKRCCGAEGIDYCKKLLEKEMEQFKKVVPTLEAEKKAEEKVLNEQSTE